MNTICGPSVDSSSSTYNTSILGCAHTSCSRLPHQPCSCRKTTARTGHNHQLTLSSPRNRDPKTALGISSHIDEIRHSYRGALCQETDFPRDFWDARRPLWVLMPSLPFLLPSGLHQYPFPLLMHKENRKKAEFRIRPIALCKPSYGILGTMLCYFLKFKL